MPRALPRWIPLAILTVSAFWIRSKDLGARPMHSDEANQAVKAGQLLESGRYAFDPSDHHGPVLYYAVLPVAWARGQRTLAELDETTVRLVPAIAGAFCVLLVGLLAAPLGRRLALTAAAFVAVSPLAVYYSRDFIQETLLLFFTLGAFWAARCWYATGRARWALLGGASAGLMLASKESAPLYLAAGLLALLPSGALAVPPVPRRAFRDLLLAGAAALAVAAALYSSLGTHPGGLADALRAYRFAAGRLASGATGQEKPWDYYLGLFGWRRAGGLVFEQAGFTALALFGAFGALRSGPPLLRWALGYTALILLALSATAYKTPWNAIHLVPGLAILAAGALAAPCRGTRGRLACGILALGVMALLALETGRTSFTYASDERNPYAYVHTSPDMLKVRALAQGARALRPDLPIRVVSEEYWPIPWYLRGIGGVGYWTSPPGSCDGSLVLASADLARTVASRLHGPYSRAYLGLRPGFVLVAFTPAP